MPQESPSFHGPPCPPHTAVPFYAHVAPAPTFASLLQTVTSRLWNLDRLDQRELPLDGTYTYGTGGRMEAGQPHHMNRHALLSAGLQLSHMPNLSSSADALTPTRMQAVAVFGMLWGRHHDLVVPHP